MKVFQIRMKVYMLKDIPVEKTQMEIASLIDKSLAMKENLLEFHEKNQFKFYCFDLPYPMEKDKVYKKGKIYTITIRTVKEGLAKYFYETIANQFTDSIKGLTSEIRIIPKKIFDTLQTLTPVIVKTDDGYWKSTMNIEEYQENLRVNLIKKWNSFYDEKLDEDFEFCTLVEILNDKPVAFEYKKVKLLGDKIRLHIADDSTAQNLAYLAIGTGLGSMNSRGAGFAAYRYL